MTDSVIYTVKNLKGNTINLKRRLKQMKNLMEITGAIQVTRLKKILIGGIIAINLGVTLNYQYQIAALKTVNIHQLEVINTLESDVSFMEEVTTERQKEIDKLCENLWVEETGE